MPLSSSGVSVCYIDMFVLPFLRKCGAIGTFPGMISQTSTLNLVHSSISGFYYRQFDYLDLRPPIESCPISARPSHTGTDK